MRATGGRAVSGGESVCSVPAPTRPLPVGPGVAGEAGSEEERGFPGCRALGLGRQRSCVGMLDWVGGVSLSVVLLFVLSWLRAFVCVSV